MLTKIGEYKTYNISYDDSRKKFVARDESGDEVSSAVLQEDLEKQIDKLVKFKWNFPINAYERKGSSIVAGRVTSCNPNDSSIRFVANEHTGWGSGVSKENLRYSRIYEATPANAVVLDRVTKLREQIAKLEQDAEDWCDKLEKKMDVAYFGLPERRGY